MKFLLWLKKIPIWAWIAAVAVGIIITTVLGWRRAAGRLAAALERARSAETSLEIETTAAEEHAEVDAGLDTELEELENVTEERLEGLEVEAEKIEAAEDAADGSLADLANEHFENEG